MVVAKLGKKEDIDAMEASIYRKTLKYANNIASKSQYHELVQACWRGAHVTSEWSMELDHQKTTSR